MYQTNQKVLMRIEKNEQVGIPETMRVIETQDTGWFLVQSLRDDGHWILQAEWKNPKHAMIDCANWYLLADNMVYFDRKA